MRVGDHAFDLGRLGALDLARAEKRIEVRPSDAQRMGRLLGSEEHLVKRKKRCVQAGPAGPASSHNVLLQDDRAVKASPTGGLRPALTALLDEFRVLANTDTCEKFPYRIEKYEAKKKRCLNLKV